MRGRKPKPTALKQLQGFAGKRAANEPKPEGNLAEPPSWLTNNQKEGWAYALAHAPRNLLKRIDRGVLTVWVVAEDLHRQASTELASLGSLLVKPPKSALPFQSPYLPIINKQAQVMMKAAEQFGFTPASRPRIAAPVSRPPDDDDAQDQTAASAEGEGAELAGYLARNPSRLN